MSQSVEWYVEHVDELLQKIVSAWGQQTSAGNNDKLTPEFKSLFEKACEYQQAKRIAENGRVAGAMIKGIEDEEREAKFRFAKECKTFEDSLEKKATAR